MSKDIMIEHTCFFGFLLYLICVSIIDIKKHIIHNVSLAVLLILDVGFVFFDSRFLWLNKVITFIVSSVIFLLIYLIFNRENKTIIGGGDVKLFSLLALFLGWQRFIISMFIMSVLVLFSYIFIGKEKSVPLAPFISIGSIVSVLLFI